MVKFFDGRSEESLNGWSSSWTKHVRCKASVYKFGGNHDVVPPEMPDLIIDHLYDDPTALKTCCIVSKSWVPRTRKQLFARVKFDSTGFRFKLWKKAFPDPSNSPSTQPLHS